MIARACLWQTLPPSRVLVFSKENTCYLDIVTTISKYILYFQLNLTILLDTYKIDSIFQYIFST